MCEGVVHAHVRRSALQTKQDQTKPSRLPRDLASHHPERTRRFERTRARRFVLVFPGFTGVLAGSNLSGHLLAPTRSIARGTFASLAFVVATYAAICLTLAATVERPYLKSNLRIMDTVVSHTLHLPLGQVHGDTLHLPACALQACTRPLELPLDCVLNCPLITS